MSAIVVTPEVISATIDRDYSGDVLAFLADLIDYCNPYTTFGTPIKHSPLEEVRHEFNAVLCTTCDVLLNMSDGAEPAIVELEEEYGTEYPTVYATRYYQDIDTCDLIPEDWSPCFTVTCPEKLASLCEYIGVNFCYDFFKE